MLTIGTVVLGVENVPRAIRFWTAALDYVHPQDPEESWVILVPKQGPGTRLALQPSETPVQMHPRVHLDLYAPDQEAEVERLIDLGAERVDWDRYREDADFVVLADPDGNRFCVIDKGDQWSASRRAPAALGQAAEPGEREGAAHEQEQ